MARPTICLNMIVKNEAAVIGRCLTSVLPFIDCWLIVDTGSTDGTQDRLREYLAGRPGELHERPWKSFDHNRNEALALAKEKANYLFFIDADETLRLPPGFICPPIDGDAYTIRCEYCGMTYWRRALVGARIGWRWEGVVHEHLTCDQVFREEHLDGPRIVVSHDGARSRDPATYAKDAALLESALQTDPTNARYTFYLAQSYRDAGALERSRIAYQRRATMGGWDEEVWYSLYQLARLDESMNKDSSVIVQSYLTAFQNRPRRAEPLYHLARFHRERGELALAHLFARHGAAIPYPSDLLFVEDDIYRWRLLDELGTAAYYVGAMTEGRDAIERLLAEGNVPASERARIEANRHFYLGSPGRGEPNN